MSLDQNLFTLNIRERPSEPHILELIDPQETAHYRKERVDGSLYLFNIFDPLSESLLASVSAPSASSKQKTIELHNPSVPVELKFTGNIFGSFRWTFIWEEHEFEWKREECYIIRKPDPPVLVAITKEPAGKIRTQSVQIMDYNLHRFDVHDRKGLEIVMLSALLSFQDYNESLRSGTRREDSSSSVTSQQNGRSPVNVGPPPALPPPRPPKSGVEKIAALQAENGVDNIVVYEDGGVEDYAQYCSNMLKGDMALFIVLRSSSPETVSKVLQVVHQTKRILHMSGEDDELYQYVKYDTESSPLLPGGKKGPRVIKLDGTADNHGDKYQPPSSLTVHLSKIPMPELLPKLKTPVPPPPPLVIEDTSKLSRKERAKIEKEEKKKQKEREKREKEEADAAAKRARTKVKEPAPPAGTSEQEHRRRRPTSQPGRSRLSKSPPRTSNALLQKPSSTPDVYEPPPGRAPTPPAWLSSNSRPLSTASYQSLFTSVRPERPVSAYGNITSPPPSYNPLYPDNRSSPNPGASRW